MRGTFVVAVAVAAGLAGLATGQIDDWFYWTNGNAANGRRAA